MILTGENFTRTGPGLNQGPRGNIHAALNDFGTSTEKFDINAIINASFNFFVSHSDHKNSSYGKKV
jgi:hypothetical protein